MSSISGNISKLRMAWTFCVLGAVVVYGVVVLPVHREIEKAQGEARHLYDLANRNERIVAQEPAVGAALRRIRNEIVRFAGAPRDSTASELLDVLDHESRNAGVRVIGVNPSAAATPSPRAALDSEDLVIDLQGKFSSIVAFVADLTDAKPLLGIRSISLNVSQEAVHGSPDLRAAVTARLYHLDENWREHELDASRAVR